ncbi:glycoside hydrolase family 3 C-terminal domain-containing protein [Paenibacillus sp. JNUCC31]|uniref:glycoside hydrolase family 3 protein n=1 Tax=Paenibacillus sp. JNUCC-31 TaxID=2777983 RepID=UPI0017865C18|nr:glycoside hydrolase family 3 protein [Paenibacillus sp. JNUCC-31]QOS79412.1 glycoside hydrolase family 3 C-terminal domain-containing protein [Paenibacillus sp. JNUCC-31]
MMENKGSTQPLNENASTDTSSSYVPARDSSGKPIFDGDPSQLKDFVNYILDNDLCIEDLMLMANPRKPDNRAEDSEPTISIRVNAGYELPLEVNGRDHVQGVYTDFPASITVGQSWNSDLAHKIGTVIGNEKRGSVTNDQINEILIWTAIADIRINPLVGRFEEGFSEDPFLTSEMAGKWATGVSGVNVKDNDKTNDFYLKAALQSKHYPNYFSEWFRMTGSYYISTRGMHEYTLPPFLKQLTDGSIVGFMTSYGRTNGVPNPISPDIKLAQRINPFSTLMITDFNSPHPMVTGMGNGFDTTYIPDNQHQSALFAKIGSSEGTFIFDGSPGSANKAQSLEGYVRGLFGVDTSMLKEAVRPTLEMMVRIGYFNKKDEQGYPIGYPFTNLLKQPQNENTVENQRVALQAAHEGIVLLKNNNTLPLQKNTKAAVVGPMADVRLKGFYAANTPKLEGAGLTGLSAIQSVLGSANVSVDSGEKLIALQSMHDNTFLTVTSVSSTDGLASTGATPKSVADPVYKYRLPGSGEYVSDHEAFAVIDWGQDAYSFCSLANGKYLSKEISFWFRPLTNPTGDVTINGDKPKATGDINSPIDSIFRYTTVTEGAYRSVNGTVYKTLSSTGGGILGDFEVAENSAAYMSVGNRVTFDTPVDTYREASDKSPYVFKEHVLQQPGANAAQLADRNDYAVIFVGASPQINSGEGSDRAYLDMGSDMYTLVEHTAEAFKAKGKKTVVVIASNYPVAMEKIQNNDNVDAILYQSYGGQYDGKALTDVLYGDYAPTGRLASTWYKDMSSFPKINNYNIPEGSTLSLSDVESRYTIDMDNGDPIATKMTYMYTNADVTYPFGYGLSYSTFKYDNLQVPLKVNANESFSVKVDVTNTGVVDTSEVVQLYLKNKSSKYGTFVPKKKLASFEKAAVPVGQTRTVTLLVDPKNFTIWDVNSQKNVVETGVYSLMIGKSSEEIELEREITVEGSAIEKLDLSTAKNVWEHAFAGNNLVYREVSKERTISYLGEYYAVMSAGSDSWVAIPNVDLAHAKGIKLRVASTNETSTVTIKHGSPEGDTLTQMSFSATHPVTYKVPSFDESGATLHELGYTEIQSDLSSKGSNASDLYLVFNKEDIRVDSIQLIR